jgi:hypothetical protein
MTSHAEAIDARDVSNLQAVRDLYSRADPIPSGLADRMKFALTVHALHAEVAELMDSGLVASRGADGVAAAPTPTESVTFGSPSVSIMVSISPAARPGAVRLDGWVTVGGSQVDVVHESGTRRVTTDDNGRFVIDGLPRGAVHFVIRTAPGEPDTRPVITPTVEL